MADTQGRLWEKSRENGEKYFTGFIEVMNQQVHICIVPNPERKEGKHPTHNIIARLPINKGPKKGS